MRRKLKGWMIGGLVGLVISILGLLPILAYLIEHFCRYNLLNFIFSLPLMLSCKFSFFNLRTHEILLIMVHILFYVCIASLIGLLLRKSKNEK